MTIKKVNILLLLLYSILLGGSVALNNVFLLIGLLTPILLILTVIINYKYIFSLYILTLPLDFILVIPAIGSLSKVLSILCCLSFLVTGLKNQRFLVPPLRSIFILILGTFSIFSLGWSINQEETFSQLLTLLPLIVFYLITSMFQFNKNDLYFINKSAIFSILIIFLYGIVQYFLGVRFEETGRFTITFFDKQADPNYLMVSMLLPLSIAIGQLSSKDEKSKLKLIFILLCAFVIILLSGSRGALLAISGVLLYWFFKDGIKIKKIFYIVLPVLSLLVIYYLLPSYLAERYSISTIVQEGGTGRLDIWKVGINAFKESPIIGYGLGSFNTVYDVYVSKTYMDAFWGYSKAAHNTFIRSSVELGIIGGFTFILILYKHFIRAKSQYNSSLTKYIHAVNGALIGIFIACMSLDIILFKYFWFILQYALILYNLKLTERRSI